jgi:hypothetical protein
MKFVPESGISLETHLEDLAMRNAIEEFENDMMIFWMHYWCANQVQSWHNWRRASWRAFEAGNRFLKERVGFRC